MYILYVIFKSVPTEIFKNRINSGVRVKQGQNYIYININYWKSKLKQKKKILKIKIIKKNKTQLAENYKS